MSDVHTEPHFVTTDNLEKVDHTCACVCDKCTAGNGLLCRCPECICTKRIGAFSIYFEAQIEKVDDAENVSVPKLNDSE